MKYRNEVRFWLICGLLAIGLISWAVYSMGMDEAELANDPNGWFTGDVIGRSKPNEPNLQTSWDCEHNLLKVVDDSYWMLAVRNETKHGEKGHLQHREYRCLDCGTVIDICDAYYFDRMTRPFVPASIVEPNEPNSDISIDTVWQPKLIDDILSDLFGMPEHISFDFSFADPNEYIEIQLIQDNPEPKNPYFINTNPDRVWQFAFNRMTIRKVKGEQE